MESDTHNRCLICSTQIFNNCPETEQNYAEENSEGNRFGETLFNILELDGSEFRTETKMKTMSSSILFCPVCEGKMGRITDTLSEFENLKLQLHEFRTSLEADLVQAYNHQKQRCLDKDKVELSLRGKSNSSILLELIVRDLNARKGIALDSFTLTDMILLEEIKQEAEDFESLPSPLHLGIEAVDDLFDEQMTEIGASASVYFDTKDPRRAALKKRIEIELERIDEIYPILRSKTRLSLPEPAETSTVPEVDDFFNFVPPENLLDMSYYSFPTKCLAEGCTSRVMYKEKWMLRRHIKNVHIGLPRRSYDPFNVLSYPTKCTESDCSEPTEFSDKISLVRHMKSMHWPKKESLSKIPVNLDIYRRFPTKCKEKGCTRNTIFRERYLLVRHIRAVHLSKIKDPILDSCTFPTKCPIEGCKSESTFVERYVLKRHLRDVHRPDKPVDPLANFVYPSKCPEADCNQNTKLYSSRDTLRKHLATIHYHTKPKKELLSLQCEECGELCKSRMTFKNHCRIHTGEILVCEDCGSQFRSVGGLKSHRETHHAPVDPLFPCPLCPKTFKIKVGLKIHLNRHNGVKKIFCQLCPAGFLFKWELRNHQSYNHSKELNLKRTECTICGKHFSKPQILDAHMVQHTGEARYNCESCPYKTSRRVDFNEHVATVHSTEFGFECTKCGKRFKLQRRLKSHMLTHKEEYDHECQDCDQRFASARTLQVHMRRKHQPDTNCPDESSSRIGGEQVDTTNNGVTEDVEESQT